MRRYIILFFVGFFVWILTGCRQQPASIVERKESVTAKQLLQGIWVDEESETVVFKIKGDTVYYPDSTSVPAYFKVVEDTLVMGSTATKYPILKQGENIFSFKSPNGDVIKLVKSDDPNDALAFGQQKPPVVFNNQIVKRDTIVMLDGERYHCYIAITPSRKVTKSEMTSDGVQVDNVYYDNSIYISIFNGANKVFARQFRKQMYAGKVPASFLNEAVLNDMVFDKVDDKGFHFNATLCIPDAASCYMVATIVSKQWNTTMELLEY